MAVVVTVAVFQYVNLLCLPFTQFTIDSYVSHLIHFFFRFSMIFFFLHEFFKNNFHTIDFCSHRFASFSHFYTNSLANSQHIVGWHTISVVPAMYDLNSLLICTFHHVLVHHWCENKHTVNVSDTKWRINWMNWFQYDHGSKANRLRIAFMSTSFSLSLSLYVFSLLVRLLFATPKKHNCRLFLATVCE